MARTMIALSTLALLGALSLSVPAFAEDTAADVSADVGAVQKDNAALAKDNAKIAKHRAHKAKAKANGDMTGQATESLSIGADKTMRSEKENERSADKKILRHDVNDATEDSKEK